MAWEDGPYVYESVGEGSEVEYLGGHYVGAEVDGFWEWWRHGCGCFVVDVVWVVDIGELEWRTGWERGGRFLMRVRHAL